MDVIPSFGGLEVTTSSTALHELTDAFLYLARYPYQGTEQIASRMLAVAALRDVLGAMNAEGLPSPDSIRASVDADVRALAARQNPDGGFAAWERGRRTWPYASIHAAHALQRAREAGYDVPRPLWDGAMRYVRSVPPQPPRRLPGGGEAGASRLRDLRAAARGRRRDRRGARARRSGGRGRRGPAGGGRVAPLGDGGARGPAEVRDSLCAW
jgi:uncharacterized protein YfaS (alpha-2-macroglobulin family)